MEASISEAACLAVVQARMGSTRLPGKVLADLAGRPVLERVVERTRSAVGIDRLCVATTTRTEDDAVVLLADRLGVAHVRGDVSDVLNRFLLAARTYDATEIVRLTADNPLVDGGTIDRVVFARRRAGCAYARTSADTYPYGLSVEVMTRDALEVCGAEAEDPLDREHVTRYLQRHADRFGVLSVDCDFAGAGQRWTIDTPADLARIRSAFADLNLDQRAVPPAGIAQWFRDHVQTADGLERACDGAER